MDALLQAEPVTGSAPSLSALPRSRPINAPDLEKEEEAEEEQRVHEHLTALQTNPELQGHPKFAWTNRRTLSPLKSLALGQPHSSASAEPELYVSYLVHLASEPTADIKAEIDAALAPFKLGQYLPSNTYMVVGPSIHHDDHLSFMRTLRSLPHVVYVTNYDHRFKVEPALKLTALSAKRGIALAGVSDAMHRLFVHVLPEFHSLLGQNNLARNWAETFAANGMKPHTFLIPSYFVASPTCSLRVLIFVLRV